MAIKKRTGKKVARAAKKVAPKRAGALRITLDDAGLEALVSRAIARLRDQDGDLQPPAIGERWNGQGGYYMGIVKGDEGKPDYYLIASGPEFDLDPLPWADALKKGLKHRSDGHADFAVPTQRELMFCFVNGKSLFKDASYWSSTQYSAYYAWLQDFDSGYAYRWLKYDDYRAFAVRRVLIQSFSHSK